MRVVAEDEEAAAQHPPAAEPGPPISSSPSAQRGGAAGRDIALVARQVFTELRGDTTFQWLQQFLGQHPSDEKTHQRSTASCSAGATGCNGWVPLSSAFSLLCSAAPHLAGSAVQCVVTTLSCLADDMTALMSAAGGSGGYSGAYSPAVSPPSSFYSPNGRMVLGGSNITEVAPQKQGGHVVLAHLGVVLLSWIASRSCSLVDVIAAHGDLLQGILRVGEIATPELYDQDARSNVANRAHDMPPPLESITTPALPEDDNDVHQWAADRWLLEWASERLAVFPAHQEDARPSNPIGGGLVLPMDSIIMSMFPRTSNMTPPPTQNSSPQRSARGSLFEVVGIGASTSVAVDITPIRPSARFQAHETHLNDLSINANDLVTPGGCVEGATPFSGDDDQMLLQMSVVATDEKFPTQESAFPRQPFVEQVSTYFTPSSLYDASPPMCYKATQQPTAVEDLIKGNSNAQHDPAITSATANNDFVRLLHLQRARQLLSVLLPHCPAPLLDHMVEECLEEVEEHSDSMIAAGNSGCRWSDAAEHSMALVHFVAHRWDVGVGAAFSGSYVSSVAVTHFDATRWLVGSGMSDTRSAGNNSSIVRNTSALSQPGVESSPAVLRHQPPPQTSPPLTAPPPRECTPTDSGSICDGVAGVATTNTARHRLSGDHPSKKYHMDDDPAGLGSLDSTSTSTHQQEPTHSLIANQAPTQAASKTNLRRRMSQQRKADAAAAGDGFDLSVNTDRDTVVAEFGDENPRCGGGCCRVM
jgi:hypothetical protein